MPSAPSGGTAARLDVVGGSRAGLDPEAEPSHAFEVCGPASINARTRTHMRRDLRLMGGEPACTQTNETETETN